MIRSYKHKANARRYGRILKSRFAHVTAFEVVPHPTDFTYALRVYLAAGESALVSV